jgi:hypothetical protein
VGEGRSKRYRPETADVLRFIAEGFNRKLTATEIEDSLIRMFPRNIDVFEPTAMITAAAQQQPLLAILEQQQQTMMQVAVALNRIVEQDREIAELRKHIVDLENQQIQQGTHVSETLRKQDEQIGELLSRVKTYKKEKRGFLNKLFGK